MPTPSAYLPVLQTGRWFAHLPPDFAQPLIAMAHLRLLQTGEALFLRGDAPCGLYAVVRGAISISGTGGRPHEARAALLTRLEPPHWFGEISVFDNDGNAANGDSSTGTVYDIDSIPDASNTDTLQDDTITLQRWTNTATTQTENTGVADEDDHDIATVPV